MWNEKIINFTKSISVFQKKLVLVQMKNVWIKYTSKLSYMWLIETKYNGILH